MYGAMKRSPFKLLLFMLAIFAGQWLVLAHDLEHSALALQDANCQVCAHGGQMSDGVPAALALTWPTLAQAARAEHLRPDITASRPNAYAIRAPPFRFS